MFTARLVPALALLGSAACLQVEADIPRACFLQSDVSIAPVNAEEIAAALALAESAGIELPQVLPSMSVQQTFTRDGLEELPQTLSDFGAEGQVRLLNVDLTATTGLDSFAGIERVALYVTPTNPESVLPALLLAECDQAKGCSSDDGLLILSAASNEDLVPYLAEGELDFTVELTGTPPTSEWVFDVDVCMSASASYELSVSDVL